MTINRLGSVGERQELLIRQGGTLGPFRVNIRNPDGSPVNLTGSTFHGQVRRKALDTEVAAAFVTTLVDAVGGVMEFGMAADTTGAIETGERPTDPESKFQWDLEWVDATGRVLGLLWGEAIVHREVTRAPV